MRCPKRLDAPRIDKDLRVQSMHWDEDFFLAERIRTTLIPQFKTSSNQMSRLNLTTGNQRSLLSSHTHHRYSAEGYVVPSTNVGGGMLLFIMESAKARARTPEISGQRSKFIQWNQTMRGGVCPLNMKYRHAISSRGFFWTF